jgi:hypothetical protein
MPKLEEIKFLGGISCITFHEKLLLFIKMFEGHIGLYDRRVSERQKDEQSKAQKYFYEHTQPLGKLRRVGLSLFDQIYAKIRSSAKVRTSQSKKDKLEDILIRLKKITQTEDEFASGRLGFSEFFREVFKFKIAKDRLFDLLKNIPGVEKFTRETPPAAIKKYLENVKTKKGVSKKVHRDIVAAVDTVDALLNFEKLKEHLKLLKLDVSNAEGAVWEENLEGYNSLKELKLQKLFLVKTEISNRIFEYLPNTLEHLTIFGPHHLVSVYKPKKLPSLKEIMFVSMPHITDKFVLEIIKNSPELKLFKAEDCYNLTNKLEIFAKKEQKKREITVDLKNAWS